MNTNAPEVIFYNHRIGGIVTKNYPNAVRYIREDVAKRTYCSFKFDEEAMLKSIQRIASSEAHNPHLNDNEQ